MPLPVDDKMPTLSREFLTEFETISGQHPGLRPMHARGILLRGTFHPSLEAELLSRALHLTRLTTPITVRFSNFSGIPTTGDNEPDADPRGCAIRFHLAEHDHTDIVSHSTPFFPAGNAQEFMAMLRAMIASGSDKGPDTPMAQHLRAYPKACAFAERPKPVPSSYARETYYGLTAVRFANQNGESRYGRYRIVPEAGNDFLDDAAVAAQPPHFLFDEISDRVKREPVRFRLVVQLANSGDEVNDSTSQWPEDRMLFTLGQLRLTELVTDSGPEQQRLIFDPIPRLDGIEPSDDPLLELRSAVYLLSGQRRRAALTVS